MKKLHYKKINLIALFSLVIIAMYLFSSCTEPSPLYGTWSDNTGNKIAFMNDSTYIAQIIIDNTKSQFDGDYTVMQNVLVFSKSSGGTIVTEWDIRGNIMYLDWTTADGTIIALNLYKTAN